MKRSVLLSGLLVMLLAGFNTANAQVRVFVNVGPVIPACRPNVVVVPAPAPVVYAPAYVCHSNCHAHHTHSYHKHHSHGYNKHNNHGHSHHNYGNGNNNNRGNSNRNGNHPSRRR